MVSTTRRHAESDHPEVDAEGRINFGSFFVKVEIRFDRS